MNGLAKENSLPVREHQAGREKLIPTRSIPQERGHIPYSLEDAPRRDPIGQESFVGNAQAFGVYLKAQKIFLDLGIFAPYVVQTNKWRLKS